MFAGVLEFVADALNTLIDKLPGLDTSWLSAFSEGIGTLTTWLLLAFEVFPPIETLLLVLLAGLAVEVVLIVFYFVNWLIKKIPFIG